MNQLSFLDETTIQDVQPAPQWQAGLAVLEKIPDVFRALLIMDRHPAASAGDLPMVVLRAARPLSREARRDVFDALRRHQRGTDPEQASGATHDLLEDLGGDRCFGQLHFLLHRAFLAAAYASARGYMSKSQFGPWHAPRTAALPCPGTYTPPASIDESFARWQPLYRDGRLIPACERGADQERMHWAVTQALRERCFFDADLTDIAAGLLGVGDAPRQVGRGPDGCEGGAFGMDAYLARKQIEEEVTERANLAAARALRLMPGQRLGRLKTNDGKIYVNAVVDSVAPREVTVIAARGSSRYRLKTVHMRLAEQAIEAGNDCFVRPLP